jgi:DNA-binding transcriptional regulator LsrR (DeoR family)
LRDSRVVQLNGAGNTFTTGVTYSGEILRRFGEAYGSTVEQFPVPAFFDDPSAKETLWRERSTKRSLNEGGIVGDIATVFYRADGSSDGIALNNRSTGPSLDVIRAVPRKICVIAGPSRLPSLKGALAGKYISDLIIDDGTAAALLEEN